MVVVTGTNNEWVPVVTPELPFDMIISDASSALYGTLVSLTDPGTVSTTVAANAKCAGVLARDKVANDGHTRISVYKRGTFRAVCSGAVTIGDPVVAAGVTNMINNAPANSTTSGSAIIGYALETGSDQEEIEVELRLS